jgi:iron transport multicopper oxidase
MTGRSAFFNGITYVPQKVPTLYTALSAPADVVTNASIYGANSHALILNYGDIVELIVNNDDTGKHPFHLHAHNFQVVARGDDNAGFYDPTTNVTLPPVPMRRDTVMVHPKSNAVLRFRADNPGVWLFHCHIEFHIDSGLVVTMVEAPLELQAQKRGQGILSLPPDHIAACKTGGNLYEGNAGGNAIEWFDLQNANYSPNPLPEGFTAGGIVALVFSILAAFLGLAVIGWYGAAEIKQPAAVAVAVAARPAGGNDSKRPIEQ